MLAELEYDHNVFSQPNQDASLAVRFYFSAVKNEEKSVEAGRPIFDDTEMIEIRVRGDRNNIVQRPVRPEDQKRFRDAYRAFKEDQKATESGTPLAEWPHVTTSLREELKYLGFTTVEHLATANDDVCGKVPGLTSLKQKADAFLKLAQGAAPLEKLQSSLEEEKAKREALEAQVAELSKLLSAKEKK